MPQYCGKNMKQGWAFFLSSHRLSRGSWFDAAVFAANCWLVPRLTALSSEDGERNLFYAVVLLIGLFLYLVGAGLKRAPLQERLARTQNPPVRTWAWITLFTLLIMQFALGILMSNLSLETLVAHFPLIPRSTENTEGLMAALLIACALVFMTIRALVPPKSGALALRPAPALRRQEAFADCALYFSALAALSIWDGMIMSSLVGRGPYPWYLGMLLVTLITVPFAMFYAAPRILFLAEDYRRPATWFRLIAVMIPLSLRLLETP